MIRSIAFLALTGMVFSSCSKKESADTTKPGTEAAVTEAPAPASTQTPEAPHAFINLKTGSRIPGVIVASTKTDMVVAGDDGIEHKIPLSQVNSVEYGESSADQACSTGNSPARRAEASGGGTPQFAANAERNRSTAEVAGAGAIRATDTCGSAHGHDAYA